MHRVSTAFVVSCQLAFAAPCGAAEIHVPGDQPTIQAAVNAANAGDVIRIAAGKYTEDVSIVGKTDLALLPAGAAKVEMRGSGSFADPAIYVENSTQITLDGLSFKKTKGDAVWAVNSQLDVTNCTFKSIGFAGVRLQITNGCSITNCLFDKTKSNAIATDATMFATISGNVIVDAGRDGISLSVGSPNGPTTFSTIAGNLIENSKDDGIDVRGSDNDISGNTIVTPGEDGLEVDIGSGGSDNVFANNQIVRPRKVAIKLGGANNEASANTIVKPGGDAIQARGTGGHLIGSNIIKKPGGDGVWVQSGANLNSISTNEITKPGKDGIDIESNSNLCASNVVTRAGDQGLEMNGTGNSVTDNVFVQSKKLDIQDTTGGNNTYTNNTFDTSNLP